MALACALALANGAPAATAVEPTASPALRASAAPGSIPVYAQRTFTLQPVAVRSIEEYWEEGGVFQSDFRGTRISDPPRVGWMQVEPDNATRDAASTYQTAVKFDMSPLDAVDGEVTRAVIRFDEKKDRWTSGSGAEQFKDGCVAHLGIATTDWAGQSVNALIPNKHYSSPKDGSSTSWSVLNHVKEQLAAPNKASLRHGYVFYGSMAIANLHADDDTSCASFVSNFRLEVTMEVAEAAPPPPAPPPPPPPPPPPSKPDLMVTRVSGPPTLADGDTAVYEIVLWNDGTPAKDTAQIQISALGPITLDSMVQLPDGFTCDTNDFGVACVGSLGGLDDPTLLRGATFKMQVRGNGTGKATLIGSANHDRALDEMTVDNNMKMFDMTVQ
jgi:hypothetical protein